MIQLGTYGLYFREKGIKLNKMALLFYNKNAIYAENTMYIAGIYKAMSIISDFIRQELDLLDKWSDSEEKRISN